MRSRSLVQTTFSFTATWRIVPIEKVQSCYNNFAHTQNAVTVLRPLVHRSTTVKGLQMLLFT